MVDSRWVELNERALPPAVVVVVVAVVTVVPAADVRILLLDAGVAPVVVIVVLVDKAQLAAAVQVEVFVAVQANLVGSAVVAVVVAASGLVE
jgi:hypothetical protein